MNHDVEQLVREGLDRLAATTEAPAGIVVSAQRRNHRRRLALGSALASGTAAVLVVAVVATGATGLGRQPGNPSLLHARTEAYVVLRHTARALAAEHQVMLGQSSSRGTGDKTATLSTTWSYQDASRWVEYWPGNKPYVADGTAEIHGKLRGVYVSYYNRKWSGGNQPPTRPAPACSKTSRLGMGGPAPAIQDWPGFIGTILGCGDAAVTGRVWINGVHTIRITGVPVRTRLPKGMVNATSAGVRFTLYVNPATFLPVRMTGSTTSFGGGAAPFTYSTVTNIQWLPPTAGNIARSIITIPPGFRHVKSPADQ
jgi:hypothetical protein